MEIYEILHYLQGIYIPRLFHVAVTGPCGPGPDMKLGGPRDKYINSPEILMKYIGNFIKDLLLHVPRDQRQALCGEAIHIIHLYTTKGIMVSYMSWRRLLVRKDVEGDRFRIFLIDFASCECWYENDDERHWWHLKAVWNEEGAIGYLMRKYLKKSTVYRPSEFAQKLRDEYEMESPSDYTPT